MLLHDIAHKRAMKTENKWSEFGRLLNRYRLREAFSQKGLWEELKAEGIELYDKSSISRWEAGKHRPSIDTIEALERILDLGRGRLLRAAGYLVEDSEPDDRRSSIQPERPITRLRQARLEHFAHLAEMAAELLSSELDTVSPTVPDLPQDSPRARELLTYHLQYEIGKDEYRRGIRGGRLSQILMSNWYPVYEKWGASQSNSLVHHLMAEYPETATDELLDSRSGRPVFEYLTVVRPYWLIHVLKLVVQSKEFKGTCEICKNLNRRCAVGSTDLPSIDEQTISGLDSR